MRNLRVSGYQAAIKDGKLIGGPLVPEYCNEKTLSLFPSPERTLNLPIEETPELPYDPPEQWARGSGGSIQRAIDSGAVIERLLAAHTHTTPIPKTHYYVEPEYRAMDEGLQSSTSGGVAKVADQIRRFGADHFIIGTDFGVYTLPTPVEGFREFIACLMDLGLSDEEIRKVSSVNPGRLVDLND